MAYFNDSIFSESKLIETQFLRKLQLLLFTHESGKHTNPIHFERKKKITALKTLLRNLYLNRGISDRIYNTTQQAIDGSVYIFFFFYKQTMMQTMCVEI